MHGFPLVCAVFEPFRAQVQFLFDNSSIKAVPAFGSLEAFCLEHMFPMEKAQSRFFMVIMKNLSVSHIKEFVFQIQAEARK